MAEDGKLLDLPELRIPSKKDSLIPGIQDQHLILAGIAASGLISLLALSQTPSVQQFLRRFTNKMPGQTQQEPDNFGQPIQETRVNQPQQQQMQVVTEAQQRAQAEQIAARIAYQQQQEQMQAHQAQANSNASMYDQIGPNTIRVDPGRGRQQYRYGSPFGANISTN